MKSSESVELLEVPALYPSQSDVPLVALPVPKREAEARYRMAAARLEAALDAKGGAAREAHAPGRLVVVTSPEDGDGKTTTALHLSIALAQAMGRRVALIEADTEQPSLARMLGVGPQRGLVEVVGGEAGLDEVLLKGVDGGPLFLPAGVDGGRIARPSVLLGVVNALREINDLVIVDCAPMSRSADATVLGRVADGVLLVVRMGATSSVSLSTALEGLVDTPLVGCVLNDHDGPARSVPMRGAAPVEDD